MPLQRVLLLLLRAGGHEELHLSALPAPDHLGALWNHHSLCIGGEAEHPDPALVVLGRVGSIEQFGMA